MCIRDSYIPDQAPSILAKDQAKVPRIPLVETLPSVQMIDIVGVLEAINSENGSVDIFVLSTDIGKDFGQTLYLVKASEILGLVDTPKQQVVLTKIGSAFASS